MKKTYTVLISLLAVIFLSCSNDENIIEENNIADLTDVTDYSKETSVLPELLKDTTIYSPSNSHLWNKVTTMSRSGGTSAPILVVGLTRTRNFKNDKSMFPSGYDDPRVWPGSTVYISKHMYYEKDVAIPKGATIILPNDKGIATLKNYGMNPNGKEPGYQAFKVRTEGDKDIYTLRSYGIEFTHDIQGRLMFSPPVYRPYSIKNPATMEFKYAYTTTIEW